MKNVRQLVRQSLREQAAALKGLAKKIHAHPELGFEEFQASAWCVEMLKGWGFRVQAPFAGLPTAFKATWGRGKPTLCLMAEYDALPDLGHGCGHNLIAAATLGAGKAMADAMKAQRMGGTLAVLGTPAEEGKGGKIKMIAKGALRGMDAALMAHPSFRTIPDPGCSAIRRFDVAFKGAEAHAAAAPEKGRNALDAVMLLFQGVNAWRQHVPEACRIHGIVKDGGVAPNIVPGHASCVFYLRAPDDAMLDGLERRFREIAQGAALMTATEPDVAPGHTAYKARIPNGPLNEAYSEAAAAAGLRPTVPDKPSRASSDFGDVSQEVPAAHVYFSISKAEIPGHSGPFRKAAGSAYGLGQMLRAAEALALVGCRFLSDEGFRCRVREGFGGNGR